jgi:hypothetical protein
VVGLAQPFNLAINPVAKPMRLFIVLLSVVLLAAAPVLAELSATTGGYLQEIGIDPGSREIAAVANDRVRLRDGSVASLDELARKQKSKADIMRFVGTRHFVRAYRQDAATRLPATDRFDEMYLTDEERALVRPALRRAGDELYLRSLQQGKQK